jgi:hypothetical protein
LNGHATRATEADYYSVLGVHCTATNAEIERAYQKALTLERLGTPSPATGSIDAKEAYETLGDPVRRLRYDAARAHLRVVHSNVAETSAPPDHAGPAARNTLIGRSTRAPAEPALAPNFNSGRWTLLRLIFCGTLVLIAGLIAGSASYKLLQSGRAQRTTTVQAVAPPTPSPRATRTGISSAPSGLPTLGPPGGAGFLPLPSLPDTRPIETTTAPAPPAANSTPAAATEVGAQTSSLNQTRAGTSAPQQSLVLGPPSSPVTDADSPGAGSSPQVSSPATPTSQPVLAAPATPTPQPVLHAPVVLSAPQVLPTSPASVPSGALPGAISGTPAAAPNRISTAPAPQSSAAAASLNQTPTETVANVNLPRTCLSGGGTSQGCPGVPGQR